MMRMEPQEIADNSKHCRIPRYTLWETRRVLFFSTFPKELDD